MVPLAWGRNVSEKEGAYLLDFFNSIGKARLVDESLFDILTALSGSGPAYAYYFIECLMDAAEKNGVDREVAKVFAAQTLLGGAKMVLKANHGKSTTEMIDQICAPHTSSIEAMNVFRTSDFCDTTIKAVEAALAKNREMGLDNKI